MGKCELCGAAVDGRYDGLHALACPRGQQECRFCGLLVTNANLGDHERASCAKSRCVACVCGSTGPVDLMTGNHSCDAAKCAKAELEAAVGSVEKFKVAARHYAANALRVIVESADAHDRPLLRDLLFDACKETLYEEGPNSPYFVSLVDLLTS